MSSPWEAISPPTPGATASRSTGGGRGPALLPWWEPHRLPGRASGRLRSPSRARRDQPPLVGEDDRLDTVARVELHQNAFDVGLDRRLLDHERRGDLAVRQTLRDELEDLALAGGQLVEPGIGGLADHRLGRHPFDHPLGDRWREQRIAARNG